MQQLLRMAGTRTGIFGSGIAILLMLLMGPAFARADTSVSVVDNSFSPQTITIAQGDTVTWTNNGSMNHTVTADDKSFDSGTLIPGNSFTHTFDTAGSFPYYCQFHGGPNGVGMSGIIIVSNSATSTSATSTTTSTDTATSSAATSTAAAPVLSGGSVTPNDTGATITWTTDADADAQVSYGETSNYTTTTASDGMSSTGHRVIIAGLMPNTLYHFKAISSAHGVTGMSPDETFTTTNTSASTTPPVATSTSGGTTTEPVDSTTLSDQISSLESEIKQLEMQIQSILSSGGINIPDGSLPNASTDGTAVYADNYAVSSNGSVHFTGSGFGANETVDISVGGTVIGQTHTDASGNFSVDGNASENTGDTTYWFSGTNSGKSDSVMITVVTG
jgi:plastocyanin